MIQSHPLAANYMMLFSCMLILKLISFHHVMHDNRMLIHKLEKSNLAPNPETDHVDFNLTKEQFELALKYPNNFKFKFFLRYLLAPTCCF